MGRGGYDVTGIAARANPCDCWKSSAKRPGCPHGNDDTKEQLKSKKHYYVRKKLQLEADCGFETSKIKSEDKECPTDVFKKEATSPVLSEISFEGIGAQYKSESDIHDEPYSKKSASPNLISKIKAENSPPPELVLENTLSLEAAGRKDSSSPRKPGPDDGITIEDIICTAQSPTSMGVSTVETTNSEEETDWDGVDSLSSGMQSMSFETDMGEARGAEIVLHRQLTYAQLRMVQRLMREFWVIFDEQWQSETRQHGATACDEAAGPSNSNLLEIGQTTDQAASNRPKRPREKEDGDSGNEEDRPSKRSGKQLGRADVSEIPLRLACPFRKRNPQKYCVQSWRRCALTPHTTVARVKAHLYAFHSIHQCQRCKELFTTEAELDVHIEAIEPCQSRLSEPVDGVTSKLKAKLQSRKKLHANQTEADRWVQIYEILFQPAADEMIPSPYFEPIRDSEGDDSSSSHRDFANYEAYLRRELPRVFSTVLQRAVSTETNPIEERLREQLRSIIEEAQNQTFARWRTMQGTESAIHRNAEPRLDHAAAENPHLDFPPSMNDLRVASSLVGAAPPSGDVVQNMILDEASNSVPAINQHATAQPGIDIQRSTNPDLPSEGSPTLSDTHPLQHPPSAANPNFALAGNATTDPVVSPLQGRENQVSMPDFDWAVNLDGFDLNFLHDERIERWNGG